MSRTVDEILQDPNRKQSAAQGILCYLFRNALIWSVSDKRVWLRKANNYFKKPWNAKNADLGNLNKALSQDDFTWTNFKKAVDFLDPKMAVFCVEPTWHDGRTVKYQVVLDPTEDEGDEIIDTLGPTAELYAKLGNDDGTPNTLARLYRKILVKEGVGLDRWSGLIENYVRNPLNAVPKGKKERTAVISMLQREVLSSRMSWNVFRRGIQLLAPQTETYSLVLYWGANRGPDIVRVHKASFTNPLFKTEGRSYVYDAWGDNKTLGRISQRSVRTNAERNKKIGKGKTK